MTIQLINIGNIVNDGLGDDLRTAFEKVNANFSELASTTSLTAINLGAAGAAILKGIEGTELQFRRIIPGDRMNVAETSVGIVIDNTATPAFTQITTDSGTVTASSFPALTLRGGSNGDIDVNVVGSEVSIDTVLPFREILTTIDFGPFTGSYTNAIQFLYTILPFDFGSIDSPASLELDGGTII